MKKYCLTLALILIAVIGRSQNPTIIVAGTNITISPPSGVGKVTINATGGGGLTPTTVTNITSATLTVTGQGSNVINLEAPASGSGTVTNVLTDFPWLTTSGSGTAVITISTNSVKIPSGNLEPMVLTNLTLANTPYLSLSGAGTSTITITGNGTVVTNNASPTFGTINGLTPANLATNISNTIPWVTLTGTGGNSYLFSTNSTKIPAGNVDLSNIALLNANNLFSGLNSFTNSSANSAYMLIGTNAFTSHAGAIGKSVQMNDNSTDKGFYILNPLGSSTVYYGMGDAGDANRFFRMQMNTSGDIDMQMGSTMGSWGIWDEALVGRTLEVNGNNLIYGLNSSSTHTFNGSTLTTAHALNWNSGVWRIPTATTGTVTNNAGSGNGIGADFLNGVIASNLVARTTDGTSRIDSGTNQTLRIIANNSAGVIQTEGLFTSRTNTLTAALPLVNTWYTNNGLRLKLNIAAVNSVDGGSMIVTVLGTTTSLHSRTRIGRVSTNSYQASVQPLALYQFSNFVGTATLLPGEWNESRE